MPSDSVRSSAASLAVALLDITGLNVAVAGQTGPVGAVVGGLTGESEYNNYIRPAPSPVFLSVCSSDVVSVLVCVCLSFRTYICLSLRGYICLSLIPSLYLSFIFFPVVFVSLPFRRCTSLLIIPPLYLSIIPSLN